MDFEKTVEIINGQKSNRDDPAIDTTIEALEALNRPDNAYETVLVGGTNGKGSVVEMVCEMLDYQGFSVGVYKSPHLVSITERIRTGNDNISREDFVDIYERVNSLEADLSRFELLTVMAFVYFERQDVDFAVMEVGMGGRLDATNAAENTGAVITNVGMDHSRYLGDTVEQIAREKAGIIPEKGWIVDGSNQEIVEKIAAERGSELYRPVSVNRLNGQYSFNGQKFSLPVNGSFQRDNLETALKTLETIDELPDDIGSALSGLECSGRMEVVDEEPLYIHDGAHNPEALEKTIGEIPEGAFCVFNAVEHKDTGRMIEILEEKIEKFYFTTSNFFLSESPETLSGHASKQFEIMSNPAEAVAKALEDAPPSGAVVVTGSLYLVGDVKRERAE